MTHTDIITAGNSKTYNKSSGIKAISMIGRGSSFEANYVGNQKVKHMNSSVIQMVKDEPVTITGDPVELTINVVDGTVEVILKY